MVYLDHAATTPVLPQAAQAVGRAMERFGNPSARYSLGREAAGALEEARAQVADALGCGREEVVFTSGGTEGDNWAVSAARARKKGHIITSAVEHSAVLEPVKALAQQGFEVTLLPVDAAGKVSPDDLSAALREDTVLVSLMLVNNETGAVEPVAECVRRAKRFDPRIFCHTDGVQGFLKIPLTPKELGVDAFTLSGHKIGAPKGIGAMYLKKGVKLKPFILGGGQEGGLRSGTEPTVLAAGLGAAAAYGREHLTRHIAQLSGLRDYAAGRLPAQVPGLEVVCRGEAPHILTVALPKYKSETVVRFLSDRGVFVSAGSACHRGKPSHVYAALGLPKPWLDGMLRVSFGPENTREDVDALAQALEAAQSSLFTTLS